MPNFLGKVTQTKESNRDSTQTISSSAIVRRKLFARFSVPFVDLVFFPGIQRSLSGVFRALSSVSPPSPRRRLPASARLFNVRSSLLAAIPPREAAGASFGFRTGALVHFFGLSIISEDDDSRSESIKRNVPMVELSTPGWMTVYFFRSGRRRPCPLPTPQFLSGFLTVCVPYFLSHARSSVPSDVFSAK